MQAFCASDRIKQDGAQGVAAVSLIMWKPDPSARQPCLCSGQERAYRHARL